MLSRPPLAADRAEPMLARARAGSINAEAKDAVATLDTMLSLASGVIGTPNLPEVQAAGAVSAGGHGHDVTVEEAFSFAQHMSEEGRRELKGEARWSGGESETE